MTAPGRVIVDQIATSPKFAVRAGVLSAIGRSSVKLMIETSLSFTVTAGIQEQATD